MQQIKEAHQGWKAFIDTRNSFTLSVIFSLVLFTVICFIQNGNASLQALSFTSLPYFERLTLFFTTLFNVATTFTGLTLFITIVSSLLSGISIAVAYEYFLKRKHAIDAGSMAMTSLAYIFVIVGIQCASCSLVLVTLLVSLFGNLIAPGLFMSLSVWIGIVGIVVQAIVLWLLLVKLSKPLTC